MMEVYGIRTRNVQSIPIRPNLHQGEQRMKGQPPVPNWIRQFSYANWTNVFQLAPKNRSLYPVALSESWKPHFNDWTGKVLFLAKDGCRPVSYVTASFSTTLSPGDTVNANLGTKWDGKPTSDCFVSLQLFQEENYMVRPRQTCCTTMIAQADRLRGSMVDHFMTI
jgi:hypothetical protein